MANEFTSYYMEQQWESRDGGITFFPTTPNVFRIGSEVKEENDINCGYVPPIEPIYRWIKKNINNDYICDYC